MSRVRVTHTACDQAVDLTDDNRIVQPDTDVPHHCTGPAGPWTVRPVGRRFTLEYALDPHRGELTYDTQTDAQHEADQRNAHYERTRAPKPPKPAQGDLFNVQEDIA